jgi:hypothetical protein
MAEELEVMRWCVSAVTEIKADVVNAFAVDNHEVVVASSFGSGT